MSHIIGIGSDLVYIPRIADTLEHQGERFLERCFSPQEVEYAMSATDIKVQTGRLAKRWAAKEAMGKALRTGIAKSVTLKDIYVTNDADGAPQLNVQNGAKAVLMGLVGQDFMPQINLTLSDDNNYAQAFVVLSAEKL